jgi:hypothetical protein
MHSTCKNRWHKRGPVQIGVALWGKKGEYEASDVLSLLFSFLKCFKILLKYFILHLDYKNRPYAQVPLKKDFKEFLWCSYEKTIFLNIALYIYTQPYVSAYYTDIIWFFLIL